MALSLFWPRPLYSKISQFVARSEKLVSSRTRWGEMQVGPLTHLLWGGEIPHFSSIDVTRIQNDTSGGISDTEMQRGTEHWTGLKVLCRRKEQEFRLCSEIQAYLILLYYTLLHFTDFCIFYKLKARPSTSEKIMSYFIAVVWNQTCSLLGMPVQSLLFMNWAKNNGIERYSNALITTDLSCVIVCYFMCPLHLNGQ